MSDQNVPLLRNMMEPRGSRSVGLDVFLFSWFARYGHPLQCASEQPGDQATAHWANPWPRVGRLCCGKRHVLSFDRPVSTNSHCQPSTDMPFLEIIFGFAPELLASL